VKLLIVAQDYPPFSGGIATYSASLAKEFSVNDDVTVLALGAREASMYDQSRPYRTIRTPSCFLFRFPGLFFLFPYLIKREKFDVVLHFTWPTSLLSYFWKKMFPVPYFVSVHASEILDDHHTFRRRIKKMLGGWRQRSLECAQGLFPVSHYTAGILQGMRLSDQRIHVVPNGVDIHRFSPAKDVRSGSPPVILTVARLDLHKGHDYILEALGLLAKKGVDFKYLIAGQGEEERRLKKLAAEFGLSRKVNFLGFVPWHALPDIYAGADIFVMISREIPGRLDIIEGFGISFLEASASGLPVVAGRSGGVADAVRDGKTGLLVEPDDASAIAEALQRLISDKKLARQLGDEGRRWVVSEMQWRHVMKRMRRYIAIEHPDRLV